MVILLEEYIKVEVVVLVAFMALNVIVVAPEVLFENELEEDVVVEEEEENV